MKKALLVIGGMMLGYALNTETGKNVRTWAMAKAQEQVNNFIGKINEVTSDSPSSKETTPTTEEGK